MVSLKELKDPKMSIFHWSRLIICPWLLHLNTFMASCFLGLWVRRVKQLIQGLGYDEHSERSKLALEMLSCIRPPKQDPKK
jgi:hypothetical protein